MGARQNQKNLDRLQEETTKLFTSRPSLPAIRNKEGVIVQPAATSEYAGWLASKKARLS